MLMAQNRVQKTEATKLAMFIIHGSIFWLFQCPDNHMTRHELQAFSEINRTGRATVILQQASRMGGGALEHPVVCHSAF